MGSLYSYDKNEIEKYTSYIPEHTLKSFSSQYLEHVNWFGLIEFTSEGRNKEFHQYSLSL